jgi:plasmid stabilization system protein ParE
MKLLWTKESQFRLLEIEEYIAIDNQIAAINFVDELITVGESIVNKPEKGRIVPELSIDNIREIIHKNYRIVYIIKKNSIDILTVFEAHRLLKRDEIFGN